MFVAILPFSISLMVTHLESSDVRAAVVVYGLNVLLASLTLSVLVFYVAREPGLVVHGVADERPQAMYRRRWFIIGVNVFVIAVAFVEPRVAVALLRATPLGPLEGTHELGSNRLHCSQSRWVHRALGRID